MRQVIGDELVLILIKITHKAFLTNSPIDIIAVEFDHIFIQDEDLVFLNKITHEELHRTHQSLHRSQLSFLKII